MKGTDLDLNRPRVTVLMPVFNGQDYLADQIESILRQRDVDVLLQAIDDGSTDDSGQILDHLASEDPRVVVSTHEANLGLIATIGELLEDVDGDYFALADQDDLWDLDKLSRSIGALRASGAALVYSDVRICDASGQVEQASYWNSRKIRPIRGRNPIPFVFRNPAIGHTIVANRSVAMAARHPPPSLVYHEAWIVAAAMSTGFVDFINAPLGSYRSHSTNVVGPSDTAVLHRARRLATTRGKLARRQRTRREAMSAVATLHPEFEHPAALMRRRPTQVFGAIGFTRFLLRSASPIGPRAVATEIALFFLDAATGILGAIRPSIGGRG
ncbi:MAG: hypothetical protein ACI8Y4_003691 [Candidatus Poriferisodalaceae bacterium]